MNKFNSAQHGRCVAVVFLNMCHHCPASAAFATYQSFVARRHILCHLVPMVMMMLILGTEGLPADSRAVPSMMFPTDFDWQNSNNNGGGGGAGGNAAEFVVGDGGGAAAAAAASSAVQPPPTVAFMPAQSQHGAAAAQQQQGGDFLSPTARLGTAAVAAGPIGIVPFGTAASLDHPILGTFGGNSGDYNNNNNNIIINNNNNDFGVDAAGGGLMGEFDGGGGDQQQQQLTAFTPFPTLIPAERVRQLVMTATEPGLVALSSGAGGGDGETADEDDNGTAQQQQQQQWERQIAGGPANAFVSAVAGRGNAVPLGEVRDVSMMRSIPVFGYGSDARRDTVSPSGAGEAVAIGIGGTMPNNNNNNNGGAVAGGNNYYCFGGGECGAASGQQQQQQFGMATGANGAAAVVAPPMVPMVGGGAGSSYLGSDGAYEYPMVEDEAEEEEAQQLGGPRQGTNIYGGFTQGNAEMGGSALVAPYPFGVATSFGQFGGGGEAASSSPFGTSANGGGGRSIGYGGGGMGEESAEEWGEDGMMTGTGGGGGTALGQEATGGDGVGAGGAVPMPLWMGGGAIGETEDIGSIRSISRVDSEERQRYSQYLESIQQKYGVVPSRRNTAQHFVENNQEYGSSSSSSAALPFPQLASGIFSPQAISVAGSTLPYGHHFVGIGGDGTGGGTNILVPAAPRGQQPASAAAAAAVSSPFSASFGTFPPSPCAANRSPPSFIGVSRPAAAGGSAGMDCAQIGTLNGQNAGGQAGGEVGQGRADAVPWKVADQQTAQQQQTLPQRQTVPVTNFNGAISGYDGGPISAGTRPSWRHASFGTAQQQQQQQQLSRPKQQQLSRPNWMVDGEGGEDNGGGARQMPTESPLPPPPPPLVLGGYAQAQQQPMGQPKPEMGWNNGGGGEAAKAGAATARARGNGDGHMDNLRQQLLEQSLLLALLTTQQTTPISINSRMSTQVPTITTTTTMAREMPSTTAMTMTTQMTTTTAEEKAPPIQRSTTSIQALAQQIRRLPVVLYADSRRPDSRRLEVLLRDAYGLPLVTFYADRIGARPETVEANLAKLTAHRGMPYLFICGTFIGSLEHIQNYHEQKQIPRLVEYVCSGGAAEKSGADSDEKTAAAHDGTNGKQINFVPAKGSALEEEARIEAEGKGKGEGENRHRQTEKEK